MSGLNLNCFTVCFSYNNNNNKNNNNNNLYSLHKNMYIKHIDI